MNTAGAGYLTFCSLGRVEEGRQSREQHIHALLGSQATYISQYRRLHVIVRDRVRRAPHYDQDAYLPAQRVHPQNVRTGSVATLQ